MRLAAAAAVLPHLLAAQTIVAHPAEAVRTGMFQDPELRESSGVARSHALPHLLFTINDSGNEPIVFAFDSSGRALGRWRVPGVRNRDWEALAIGPCPAGSCLYIGDIGDNGERELSLTVYRVPEPDRAELFQPAGDPAPPELDSAVFSYSDGPHDAEAMWVDETEAVYIVTKGRTGGVKLFRLPPSSFRVNHSVTAELVQRLPITPGFWPGRMVTEAALSHVCRRVAIRTYTEVYLFPVLGPGRLGEPAVCSVAGLEPQGEGIEWLDTTRLILTSEAGGAAAAGPLHVVRCGG